MHGISWGKSFLVNKKRKKRTNTLLQASKRPPKCRNKHGRPKRNEFALTRGMRFCLRFFFNRCVPSLRTNPFFEVRNVATSIIYTTTHAENQSNASLTAQSRTNPSVIETMAWNNHFNWIYRCEGLGFGFVLGSDESQTRAIVVLLVGARCRTGDVYCSAYGVFSSHK